MTAQQPTDVPHVGTVLPPGAIGDTGDGDMIRASFVRLLLAGGLCLLGFALSSPGGDKTLAVTVLVAGMIWGVIEMFILAGLLFIYGVSGLVHDIGAINNHDPWNRW